ncbi:unnamed protein product [Rotaria sordida]|uniref:Uncharacterized protein n=1 Tax=Rotaria sordida TaxID=392033 RepID=A0A815QEC2_9BILA|nr:unnamed protein product [Rotaria sordida]
MMVTRASTKCKRLNNTTVKKKCKASRSSSDKPSPSVTKPQSITPSSIPIHNNNIGMNDGSSLEKDLSVIDCPDQSQQDCASTPQNVVNCNSKDLNIEKGPLSSSTITKSSTTPHDELNTEAVYKKLDAAISSCSPIVGRISSINDRNISSFTSNGGSLALDIDDDQVILLPSLSQVTPTTNRINLSHSSRVNRSEPRTDKQLSPSTIARTTANRIPLSSNSTISSKSMRQKGIQHFGNNKFSNINRNTYGSAQNNKRSLVNTQPASTDDRTTSQSTISLSSTSTLLEALPEYRKLKKELEQERQRCSTWSDDYMKLKEEFENYRASSFPRPTVDGLNFLLQLVENLTSDTSLDSRSPSELAEAIGLTEEQLMECRHSNPQRAALAVFSELYPTYSDRAELRSIKNFAKKKSNIFNDIFIFARQCNPSVIYSIDKMREALAGSIRQAKHQLKLENIKLKLSNFGNYDNDDESDGEEEDRNNSSIMDVQTCIFSSSTDSSIAHIISHTSHQPLVTNHRVQQILAYQRSTQGLFSGFGSSIHQHTISSSISTSTIRSKFSDPLDKNIDTTQQHIIPFDSEDLDDNDGDWQSIASDTEENDNQPSHNNNEMQSDRNLHSHKRSGSSSSSTTSTSSGTSYEDEEEDINSNNTRMHTSLEIAVLLSLFRHRHSLSKSCLTDMCRLLRLLGVPNVPVDYRSIYKLINPCGNSMFQPKLTVVCPTCHRVSMNMKKCPITHCNSHAGYVRAPTVNYTFKLREQIKSILERVPLTCIGTNDGHMTDVIDGRAHAHIHTLERKPFITLILNSDGVLIQKISRSLWITTMVINEIPRDVRFQLPNMVIGMVSYGSQKPKRAEFSSLLDILVDELVELEHGIDVCLPSPGGVRFASSLISTHVAVNLLGVVSDKPAQSMIQNMIDSGGFYGCGKCQIVGESVRAGKGHIRCFPLDTTNPPDLRSNKTYDQAMKILTKNKQQRARRNSLTGADNDAAKGHVGPCALRRLRFFEMGQSFLIDSLHNLYSGAFNQYRNAFAIQK